MPGEPGGIDQQRSEPLQAPVDRHGATPSWPATGQRWTPARTPPWLRPGSPKRKPSVNAPKNGKRTQARETRDSDSSDRLTEEEVVAIVEQLGDMITVLRDAAPEHKLDVYRNLGLRLTYEPDTRTVRADIDLAPHRWDLFCVRGPTRGIFTQ